MIGVAAVVAISVLGRITSEVFVAASEQLNGRAQTYAVSVRPAEITLAQLDAGLAAISPFLSQGGSFDLRFSASSVTGLVVGSHDDAVQPRKLALVTPVAGYPGEVRRLPLLSGSWPDSNAIYPINVVVNAQGSSRWGGVGTPLLIQLGPNQPPVSARVAAVVADGLASDSVMVGLRSILNVQTLRGGSLTLELQHASANHADFVWAAQQFASAFAIEVSPLDVVRSDQTETLLKQLLIQQRAFFIAAVMSLIVSAIGILNIGLASISERTRELVVRRAIGATRRDIFGQLMFASALIGAIAAAVIAALAVAVIKLVVPALIPPFSAIEAPGVPWEALGYGLMAAMITTLCGAIVPALVASRLDVADALRA